MPEVSIELVRKIRGPIEQALGHEADPDFLGDLIMKIAEAIEEDFYVALRHQPTERPSVLADPPPTEVRV